MVNLYYCLEYFDFLRKNYILNLSSFTFQPYENIGATRTLYRMDKNISLRTTVSQSETWESHLCFGKLVFGNALRSSVRESDFRLIALDALGIFLSCLEVIYIY